MKRVIVLVACFFYSLFALSQFEYGVKVGVNSIDMVSDAIVVKNGIDDLKIEYQNAEYGYHFGMYARVKLLGFYIEPAALFNSNNVNYKLTDYKEGQTIITLYEEKYKTLDVPLNIGLKAGLFRIYGGPVAHIHLRSSSELVNFKSYSQKFKDASYGFQAGFGFDIMKLRLDLAYEGNLSAFGDHINIGSTPYSFGTAASRVVGTVGYKF
jgi:hypothetical protein